MIKTFMHGKDVCHCHPSPSCGRIAAGKANAWAGQELSPIRRRLWRRIWRQCKAFKVSTWFVFVSNPANSSRIGGCERNFHWILVREFMVFASIFIRMRMRTKNCGNLWARSGYEWCAPEWVRIVHCVRMVINLKTEFPRFHIFDTQVAQRLSLARILGIEYIFVIFKHNLAGIWKLC